MVEIITIGVYGWDSEAFFQALREAGVDSFCDLRRRRGVRGGTYAFANSQRLQARLVELGITYLHHLDLAPSAQVREHQRDADQVNKTSSRRRVLLAPAFVEAYEQECLATFDSQAFLESLGPEARVVALCCVEREPEACHRSLAARRLAEDLQITVRHLLPSQALSPG